MCVRAVCQSDNHISCSAPHVLPALYRKILGRNMMYQYRSRQRNQMQYSPPPSHLHHVLVFTQVTHSRKYRA
jgi:hypothetical protein